VALEMADAGASTAHLSRHADEADVRAALRWNDAAWPWLAYGPVVMAAVRAGVPVLGANLPRERMREVMADAPLDARLPPAALQRSSRPSATATAGFAARNPDRPMTRIQIARDIRMAHALERARLPGKTVVLMAGAAMCCATAACRCTWRRASRPKCCCCRLAAPAAQRFGAGRPGAAYACAATH
jgi:uncharacterized iron-regulated protein